MAQKQRRKVPSFSSSLLDSIYHSIDEPYVRRNNADNKVEEEIESLRRAIMVEKWMENYSTPRHFSSNSGSSTDSSLFSETESRTSVLLPVHKQERFITKTKSKAMKIYGDLKKVKEPISPGGKIANFLNSIFSPRNVKKSNNQDMEGWNSNFNKSRSMKDITTRSCFSKNGSDKSKRSVRFCPVGIIVDGDGRKNLYDEDEFAVGSRFVKKNIDSFRDGKSSMTRRHEFREFYDQHESDVDDKSCASSDLFELESIGRVGIRAYDEELPVYGTTSVKMNKAIASGLLM